MERNSPKKIKDKVFGLETEERFIDGIFGPLTHLFIAFYIFIFISVFVLSRVHLVSYFPIYAKYNRFYTKIFPKPFLKLLENSKILFSFFRFYILIREGIRFVQNVTPPPPFLSNDHVLRLYEPEKMVFANGSVCLSVCLSVCRFSFLFISLFLILK